MELVGGQLRAAALASVCKPGPADTGPARLRGSASSKRIVATALAATLTGLPPKRRAAAAEHSTAAAAPLDTGQISNRRNGSLTYGEASTSSTVTALRKRAFGLPTAHRRAFAVTCAYCTSVVP